MGTSEGAKKGWTEERRKRQSETLRRQRADPEWRAAQAERTRQQWIGNDKRKAELGRVVAPWNMERAGECVMSISVAPGPNGGLIGRDRNGQALAVVAVDHLNPTQRQDLAGIYRLLAATIDPGAQP